MVAYSKNPKAADLTAATSNKLASHSLRIRDNNYRDQSQMFLHSLRRSGFSFDPISMACYVPCIP